MHYNTVKQCNMEDANRYKQTHQPHCFCLLYTIFTLTKDGFFPNLTSEKLGLPYDHTQS